jgi:hypothetical protein
MYSLKILMLMLSLAFVSPVSVAMAKHVTRIRLSPDRVSWGRFYETVSAEIYGLN